MDPYTDILACDCETASSADLKVYGAWGYSLHPSTKVYCMVFAAAGPGGERRWFKWRPGVALPAWLLSYLAAGGELLAHNASFEQAIWANVLVPQWGFPPISDVNRWRDTQAHGLAINLPPTLAGLAAALGCPMQKDKEGHALMLKMCWGDPRYETEENLDRLEAYCAQDVAATLDCWARLPRLSVMETLVHRLDQRINSRGVFLDQAYAARLSKLAAERSEQLQAATFALTEAVLENSTSTPALKEWLTDMGVELPLVTRKKTDGSFHQTESLDAAAVESLLAGDIPPVVREVLENRVEANKATSLAKLDRVGLMTGADGRLRNALQYCGANTGRWASYGLQIHNLPKDKLGKAGSELARMVVAHGTLQDVLMIEKRPLNMLSQLLRGVIAAPVGKELIGGDYSAIEARVIAWLAGQDDITAKFAAGEDVYTATAKAIGSDNRQLGKVCVLALGYGMGAVKFRDTAAKWGIPLSLKDARTIQLAWRKLNAKIVKFWHDVEDAVRCALKAPGEVYTVGRVKAARTDTYLGLRLPSGRVLRYWRPRVQTVVKRISTVDEEGNLIVKEMETDEIQFFSTGQNKVDMTVEGTYSGKICENLSQAVARDLLAEALLRLDRHGAYPPVMHVHDSIVAEVRAGTGSVDEFCKLMAESPAWADGLPVAVDGYRDVRFRG